MERRTVAKQDHPQKGAPSIHSLPIELIQHLLSFAEDFQTIASQCCRSWRNLFQSTQLPKIFVASVVLSVKLLEWAKKNGCPWNITACAAAAKGGHLEVLQWARENGCPWDESTCFFAAEEGHLEVLKWARENGCPWSEFTCDYAAKGGHLLVLQWARENGCPWGEFTCDYEIGRAHV